MRIQRLFRNSMLSLIAVLGFGWMLPACSPSENILFEEFQSVDASGWDWKDGRKFTFKITDESHYYTLNCGLRITANYAYSNIWLMYTIKGPNKYHRKDQFQMVLSDNLGKWTGKGVSNLISFQEPFLKETKLAKGVYTIEFHQNMRDEKLLDVNNIGLQLLRGQLVL